MAGTIDKIKAKVENVLHKDKDTTHTGTHTDTTHTGTTGTHTGTHTTGSGLTGSTHNDPTGPHSSHAANKADPRVDSDRLGTAGNTAGAGGVGAGQYGTTGTHGSTGGIGGVGNEAHTSGQQTYRTDGTKLPEPLLEDHSRAEHHSGAGLTHSSHTNTGSGFTGSNTHSDPTGPHDSKLANKLDPRVDSDRYGAAGNTAGAGGVGAGQYGSTGTHGTTGSGLTGSHGTHTGSGLTGSHGTTGSGLTGSHGTTGSGLTGNTGYSDPTGPHSSHAANKVDPRVDSDRYGTAGNTAGAGGVGAGQYGSTGTHTGSGLTGSHGTHTGSGLTGSHGTSGYSDPSGPHDSRLANQADPRVDSDRYGGQGNTYGTTQGSGLTGTNHPGHVGNNDANKTAGPHGSNLLNKLDPRVDSDLDGSKTTGGDRTYG
ncbi:hypothetical protein SVAN01_05540 [Stagonosporopsis vannaccii]|nr:hypothetical protein SVAN01_05540 [Stagonosporopsis vannaccii]